MHPLVIGRCRFLLLHAPCSNPPQIPVRTGNASKVTRFYCNFSANLFIVTWAALPETENRPASLFSTCGIGGIWSVLLQGLSFWDTAAGLLFPSWGCWIYSVCEQSSASSQLLGPRASPNAVPQWFAVMGVISCCCCCCCCIDWYQGKENLSGLASLKNVCQRLDTSRNCLSLGICSCKQLLVAAFCKC